MSQREDDNLNSEKKELFDYCSSEEEEVKSGEDSVDSETERIVQKLFEDVQKHQIFEYKNEMETTSGDNPFFDELTFPEGIEPNCFSKYDLKKFEFVSRIKKTRERIKELEDSRKKRSSYVLKLKNDIRKMIRILEYDLKSIEKIFIEDPTNINKSKIKKKKIFGVFSIGKKDSSEVGSEKKEISHHLVVEREEDIRLMKLHLIEVTKLSRRITYKRKKKKLLHFSSSSSSGGSDNEESPDESEERELPENPTETNLPEIPCFSEQTAELLLKK